VYLVSSAQALRPQFITCTERSRRTCAELRRRTCTERRRSTCAERRRSTCAERRRSMVDVELLPRHHQSMHFGCAQCGGF
jgi:hypothetical protein